MSAQAGTPAINLVDATETNGGNLYLTQTNAATAQIIDGGFYRIKYPTISPTTPLMLPASLLATSGNKFFLLEGATNGTGQLILTVYSGTNIIAQTAAWLDIRSIKDLFSHTHVEGVLTSWPAMRTNSTSTSTFKTDDNPYPQSNEHKQIILLVHGWNNTEWQSENYAETMFKRLYWQGYQGRFAAFRWPTRMALLPYNNSEYIAFRSGAAASSYFNALRSQFPDYSINAAAHSMGNIVMMEALKLQLSAGSNALNNYALMEAAVPAHCYDTNAPLNPGLVSTESIKPTPNTYFGYPGAINSAFRAGGKMVNFYNTNDFALALWVDNQVQLKPQISWYYIGPDVQPYLFPSILITDPREIMAFCARSRSYAVGAQGAVQGVITGSDVNMKDRFGFGSGPADHSGQFTRSTQLVHDFYRELGVSFGIFTEESP